MIFEASRLDGLYLFVAIIVVKNYFRYLFDYHPTYVNLYIYAIRDDHFQ